MGGGMVAVLEQEHYRVRDDTTVPGSGGTPNWISTQDQASVVTTPSDTTFRVRFVMANTGAANADAQLALYYQKNGTGGFSAVTGSTPIQSADASTAANATVLTATGDFLLTAGTGAALDGEYSEDNVVDVRLADGEYTEVEFGLTIDSAQAIDGDEFQLRVYQGDGTAVDVVDFEPTMQVSDPPIATGSVTLAGPTASGIIDNVGFGNVRQSATNRVTVETSVSATFGSTPQSGNLLLAHVYQGSAIESVVTITGWTQAHTQSTSNGRFTTLYRLSNGTEGTVTAASDGSATKSIQIEELYGPFLSPDPLVNATGNTESLNTVSHDSGSLISGAADDLAISVHTLSTETTNITSFTNSFVEYLDAPWESTRLLAKSKKILTTFGASTTATSAIASLSLNHILIFRPGGGALTATGNVTLAGPTASGAASQILKPSGSVTLEIPTAAGTIVQTLKPSGAATLEVLTASGQASQILKPSGSVTLEIPTASGTVTKQTIKAATGAVDLLGPTAAGTVSQILKPSGAVTLEVLTAAGAVSQILKPSGTVTIETLTAAGTVVQTLRPSGAVTLEGPTASGQASQILKPSGSVTLEVLTASGVATTQQLKIASGNVTLDSPTAAGTVVQTLKPSGNAVLAGPTAAGAVRQILKPSGAVTLAGPTASGSITQRQIASGNVTLGEITASGVATKQGQKIAFGNVTLDGPTASGQASQILKPAGNVTLGELTASGVAVKSALKSATGDVTLEGPTASGQVTQTLVAQGAPVNGAFTFIANADNHSTINAPSITHGMSIQAGDLLVAYVHINAVQTITADQAGWTEAINIRPDAAETCQHAIFWKIATGSEPATYSWQSGYNAEWGAILKQYRPPTGYTPQVDLPASSTYQVSQSTSLPCDAGNGQTISENGLSIKFGGKDNRISTTPYSNATNGYTNVVGHANAQHHAGADQLFPSGGTIPGTLITGAGQNDSPFSLHIAFIAVSPGGPTLEIPTAAGQARQILKPSGAVTLDGPTASGSITQRQIASGNVTLGEITASGVATKQGQKVALGDVTLEEITASGVVATLETKIASGAITLEELTVTGTVIQTQRASGDVTLGAIQASGVVTNGDVAPEPEQGGGSGGHGGVILPQRPRETDETTPTYHYDPKLAELAALALIAIDAIEDME